MAFRNFLLQQDLHNFERDEPLPEADRPPPRRQMNLPNSTLTSTEMINYHQNDKSKSFMIKKIYGSFISESTEMMGQV